MSKALPSDGSAPPADRVRKPEYLQASETLSLMRGDKLLQFKTRRPHRHWGDLITSSMTGMLYGPRGAGKTYAVLGLAAAMATGLPFLGLAPSRPRKVVILDGEMGSVLMKRRLRELRNSLGASSLGNLLLLTPDMYTRPLPSLSTKAGQDAIDALLPEDTDVIIIDNISSWNIGGTEDADGWGSWGEWLLRHKNRGRTVILVHHAGKRGQQRGTSRREDALDFVIALRPEVDPQHVDALCFSMVWEKLRAVGKQSAPALRVTRVEPTEGAPKWRYKVLASQDERVAQALALRREGLSTRKIGERMKVDASTVSRWLKGRPKG